MTYLAFYNPHAPEFSITIDWIYPDCLEAIHAHISSHGRITRFNHYLGPDTIVIKSCNLIIFNLPTELNDYYPLRSVLSDLWKQGKLHSFDHENYPELFL